MTASCAANVSTCGGLDAASSAVLLPHSRPTSGAMPAIDSFGGPHISPISGKLLPSWATTLDSGDLLPTRSPNEPVGPARKNATLTFVDDGCLKPPAPEAPKIADKVSMSTGQPGTRPGKARLGLRRSLPIARGFVRIPTTPRILPSSFERQTRLQDTLNVAFILPPGGHGNTGSRLLAWHVSEATRHVIRASVLHCPHRCAIDDVLLCTDQRAYHHHHSFLTDAKVDTFQEQNVLQRWNAHFRG